LAFATGPDAAGRTTGRACDRQTSVSNPASARVVTARSGNSTSTWTISATGKQMIVTSANSAKAVTYGELKDLTKSINGKPRARVKVQPKNTAIVMWCVR